MAVSRLSSNGPDLTDVTKAWEAFQRINTTKVVVELTVGTNEGVPCLQMTGHVFDATPEHAGRVCLASEALICSDTTWRSLDIAAFRLLYALDAALALREMGGKRSGETATRPVGE